MRLALVTPLVLLFACGGVPSSTFDVDDEGWTLGGDAPLRPALKDLTGNPGGHICGTDEEAGQFWYFVAPAKFLGNVSAAYGKRLTWDMKQSYIYNQIHGREVILQGGGLSLSYSSPRTPGIEWTPFQVSLEPGAPWVRDSDGQNATEADLRTVLRSVNALRFRGEFVDGPDSSCLDNVVFGTL